MSVSHRNGSGDGCQMEHIGRSMDCADRAMLVVAPSEQTMWERPTREPRVRMTDGDIDGKYSSREERIVTETNREKLPNFVEALKRPGYMNQRPIYQRRARWDVARQSRLIESFIINIPVPPLVVYENAYNAYEVMDGQQRVAAIQAFYANDLKLRGLDRWPELNGRSYSKLPPQIRAGIDRRSISYIVVLTESADSTEEALFLKQLVFERLNTGGIELSKQEVRNCLYQGRFNNLLIELSRNDVFRQAWGLPRFEKSEEHSPSSLLLDNSFYAKMEDIEAILRFFALRHADHYQRGMQGFLDLYMARSANFDERDVELLGLLFEKTIALAYDIYEDKLFIPFDPESGEWLTRAQKTFWDAVMIGISRHLSHADILRSRRSRVVEQTKELFRNDQQGTFAGRGNTKKDVQERIVRYEQMLNSVVAQ